MTDTPVQISGMGIVSALGVGLPDTLKALQDSQVNADPVTVFPSPLTCPVFEAKGVPLQDHAEQMRTAHLCDLAVAEAIAGAHLENIPNLKLGICMGTTVACQLNDLEFYTAYRESQAAPMIAVDRYLKGNLAEALATRYEARGPTVTVVNACSSSAEAVGIARLWIRNGICDAVIAGGADEINRIPLSGFNSLGIVSPEPCRPFDRDRKGLNLGEGAAALVLESVSHASQRGHVTPLRVAGYASAGDAYHLTAPRPDGAGLEQAIRGALEDARIASEDIAFINAHGTATPDNDKVEGAVLGKIFGNNATLLSTKGYTGHTLGAAGAIEAVLAATALREGWLPPSAGFSTQDPEIPITPIVETTPFSSSAALSTSLAFGGNNCALVFQNVAKEEPASGGLQR